MGKYLDIIRAAERQKAEKGPSVASVASVASKNVHSTTTKRAPNSAPLSDPSDKSDQRVVALPFAQALDRLERRCPEHIEAKRWQQCIADASRFLGSWGDKALALGWTADELFGLHEPPTNPHQSYSRMSRYDATGLLWQLRGRRVVALTADTAAIETPGGNIVTYRKLNKPALGPLGDSLDDFVK